MSKTTNSSKQTDVTKEPRVFSESEKKLIQEKLITARIGLLLKHPFFGNMATRMNLVDGTKWLPTLATDGRNFYYNNDFVFECTAKEVEFGFAHEVLHNVFDHIGRRNNRNPDLANIAADYAVNQILVDEKIGTVPKSIKIYQDKKYRGWSFEKIYDDIEKNAVKIDLGSLGQLLDQHLDPNSNDGNQQGNSGGNNGVDGPPSLSKEELDKIREEIKEAMVTAAQSVGTGNLPEGIRRLINEFIEPKMDWRQILRMNIQSIVKSNFSFSRPNRKSQLSGTVLPGLVNEETIDIAVAFDMSGSISNEMGKEMISEVKGIMEEYHDFKISVWCFDTKVYNFQEFTKDTVDDFLEYKLKGGGGTDFDCNWEFMKKEGIEPKRFIMFTDGYPYNSWGDEDYCETIFVIHGNDSIISPFGITAYYK
jgi:predicted metal-dependent peptidase